ITAAGPGKVVLSHSGTYVGQWVVNPGTLSISAENQLGASGGVTVNSGGVFELNGASMTSVPLTMNSGTLRAVGLTSYTGGSPQIANLLANVSFTVAGASDRFDMNSAINSISASPS